MRNLFVEVFSRTESGSSDTHRGCHIESLGAVVTAVACGTRGSE